LACGYPITTLALYLARYGLLLARDLTELASQLAGRPVDLLRLREPLGTPPADSRGILIRRDECTYLPCGPPPQCENPRFCLLRNLARSRLDDPFSVY
jgi:hypothetical protein